MEENVTSKIIEIFKGSQLTAASHQKYVVLLKTILDQSDADKFFKCLEMPLKRILIVDFKQNNNYIEKVMDFFASFCSSLKSKQSSENHDCIEHPLLIRIFDYLLLAQRNYLDVVRFRACQLINKILNQLIGAELSTDLCDKIESNLLDRLMDSKSVIRMQGIIALHRLQDPSNPTDPIIKEFLEMLQGDPHAKVRQLCVEKVAARRDTVELLIIRIRDVDVNVRISAYKRLSKIPKLLKIANKRNIISSGFSDMSEKVNLLMKNVLLPSWLEMYDNDILELMKSIRLDGDEKDINETIQLLEYILPPYFKTKPLKELSSVLPINENKLITKEQLNWEIISYWRIYVQYLSKNDEFEDELSLVIPELVYFVKYIYNFYQSSPKELTTIDFLEQQFILKQLFLMTKTYDFGDHTSRQALNTLVKKMLEKGVFTTDVIEVIVNNLSHTIPHPENRCKFISEIISEIMYPMNDEESQEKELERYFQVSQIKVKLNRLMDEQTKAVNEEKYLEANQLKIEIEQLNETLKELENTPNEPETMEKKTDVPTIIKYLDIASAFLLSPQVTIITPTIRSLRDDIIQEVLMHNNETVRAKALKCYALCCIIDKDSAKNGIHIFSTPIFAYQNGEECDTQTLSVCIGACVDLLRIYGSQLIAIPEENMSDSTDEDHVKIFAGGTSLTNLIQGLVDLMDDETPEIQMLAARGLCSLLISERVHSAPLVSRLVLKWCSPPLEGDQETKHLKQMIGICLQKLPTLRNSAEQLEGAVLMTIKTIVGAPRTSPLADVNIDNIAKFLLALCKTSSQGEQIHVNLATKVCSEILDRPNTKLITIYSKMLLMFDISNNKYVIRDLINLCEDMREEITDRIAVNNIIKFHASLSEKRVNMSIIEEVEE